MHSEPKSNMLQCEREMFVAGERIAKNSLCSEILIHSEIFAMFTKFRYYCEIFAIIAKLSLMPLLPPRFSDLML